MRSVIQEASTLSATIEQAWNKAGCPTEFKVKIFQKPEKGFLGFGVKKKAKVALFFEDLGSRQKTVRSQGGYQKKQQRRPNDRRVRNPYIKSQVKSDVKQDFASNSPENIKKQQVKQEQKKDKIIEVKGIFDEVVKKDAGNFDVKKPAQENNQNKKMGNSEVKAVINAFEKDKQ